MFPVKRLLAFTLLAGFPQVMVATRASADVIPISIAAFSGSETVARFDPVPPPYQQPLPYFESGLTLVSFTGPYSVVTGFYEAGDTGLLTVTFSEPVTRAGFDFWNSTNVAAVVATISVEAFSDPLGESSIGGATLRSFAPAERGFVGFAADAPFSRAEIFFDAGRFTSFLVDDFRFENAEPIPEPGTIALTGLALGLLGSRMRRQPARH